MCYGVPAHSRGGGRVWVPVQTKPIFPWKMGRGSDPQAGGWGGGGLPRHPHLPTTQRVCGTPRKLWRGGGGKCQRWAGPHGGEGTGGVAHRGHKGGRRQGIGQPRGGGGGGVLSSVVRVDEMPKTTRPHLDPSESPRSDDAGCTPVFELRRHITILDAIVSLWLLATFFFG